MIQRNIQQAILESLKDTPVVFIQGARQTGKSTLVRHIANTEYPAEYLTSVKVSTLSLSQHCGRRAVKEWELADTVYRQLPQVLSTSFVE